ncbi:MAG: pyridoxamine 5'-phosphate oxidase [Bacteroidota bacterium]|jgi:pyridoxamine 5'-phosphate oxidase
MESTSKEINKLRLEYSKEILDEKMVNSNPIVQFDLWMKEALNADIPEPHAMNVSTVSKEGKPSSRIVLLRNFSENGFVFYTNYNSKKGNDISENNSAAINFFWPQLERQIRIEGKLQKVDSKISDEYFASRPHDSQLGAWASNQSEVLKNRQELEEKFAALEKKFAGINVPRPEHWGGYCLVPDSIEFWQGRPSRIHDRIKFTTVNNEWKIERLSP